MIVELHGDRQLISFHISTNPGQLKDAQLYSHKWLPTKGVFYCCLDQIQGPEMVTQSTTSSLAPWWRVGRIERAARNIFIPLLRYITIYLIGHNNTCWRRLDLTVHWLTTSRRNPINDRILAPFTIEYWFVLIISGLPPSISFGSCSIWGILGWLHGKYRPRYSWGSCVRPLADLPTLAIDCVLVNSRVSAGC